MRIAVKKTKVYKFNELPLNMKEKAVQNLYDINVDQEWWEYDYDYFHDELKTIGIACNKFYFSLNRDYYIAMDKPSIEDPRLLLKSAGFDLRCKEARDIMYSDGVDINTNHYAGARTSNSIDNDKLNDFIKEKLECFLSRLRKDYEYLSSREAILETIEANDYDFTEDGKIYY